MNESNLYFQFDVGREPTRQPIDFSQWTAEQINDGYAVHLREAKQRDVCRICGLTRSVSPGDSFVLHYGKEYAHQHCLDTVEEMER